MAALNVQHSVEHASWLDHERSITLLAYAARLNADKCTSALLFAGADPSLRFDVDMRGPETSCHDDRAAMRNADGIVVALDLYR